MFKKISFIFNMLMASIGVLIGLLILIMVIISPDTQPLGGMILLAVCYLILKD